jgi:tetratricopeptide (TPR) repeat protein
MIAPYWKTEQAIGNNTVSYQRLKMYAEGVCDFELAMKQNPTNLEIGKNLASVLADLSKTEISTGNYAKAVDLLGKALALDGNASYYYERSRAHYYMNVSIANKEYGAFEK